VRRGRRNWAPPGLRCKWTNRGHKSADSQVGDRQRSERKKKGCLVKRTAQKKKETGQRKTVNGRTSESNTMKADDDLCNESRSKKKNPEREGEQVRDGVGERITHKNNKRAYLPRAVLRIKKKKKEKPDAIGTLAK